MKSLLNFSSTLQFSNSLKWILSLSTLFSMLLFIGCDGTNPPPKTAAEIALENLSGTWALGSVSRDASLVTDEFQGFVLTMDGSKTFSTTNGANIFPAGSQWDFKGDVPTTGVFNITAGGVDMEVTSLTGTNLMLTFTYTMPARAGRISNLSGEYVFSLEKQ